MPSSVSDSSTSLPWLTLDICHSEDDSPWVERALCDLGLEGWEVHRETPDVLWRLYFPLEGNHQERLSIVKTTLAELGATVSEAGEIRDEDWAENWKEFYHPFAVGEQLIISPSWEEPSPELAEGRKVIRLDPGSAFGTGYHESTRLCLQHMEALTTDPKWGKADLLDYGTGSGILAIGALLLGAPRVVATDRDPVAVSVSEVNLGVNHFAADRYEVVRQDVPEKNPRTEDGRFTFVVANLTADILTQLCTPLCDVVGQHLILAGIIDKRAAKVERAYLAAGGKLISKTQENDWVSYYFQFDR